MAIVESLPWRARSFSASFRSAFSLGVRGRERWVLERTFAWLHNRRRLRLRTDRRDDIHEGFLALACCLICWRRLEASSPF